MTDTLIVCSGCFRHTRASDTSCPFCRAPRTSTTSIAAAAIVGAALVGGLTHDAAAQPLPGRFGAEHSMAAGYGAPPRPFEPGTTTFALPADDTPSESARGPVEVATRAAVVEADGARLNPRLRVAMARGVDAFRACRESSAGPLARPETHVVTVRWGGPRVEAPTAARGGMDRCIERAARRLLPAGPT